MHTNKMGEKILHTESERESGRVGDRERGEKILHGERGGGEKILHGERERGRRYYMERERGVEDITWREGGDVLLEGDSLQGVV